jgi:cobalt-zinc-cadmium resistance protein CzcA
MLSKIVDFSFRQRFVALSIVVLLSIGGVMSFLQLPINSLPDVTPVQVLVITKAGRYSPPDVEQLVSFPIESAMNGLPNVLQVRSISQFGLSAVTVEFEENTDIYFARQMVSERLGSIVDDLPAGVSAPELGPISTALGEIYQYVVSGEGYSLMELREIQDWLVAPQLKIVKGVTEINSFGGFVRQYEVIVDPEKMRAYGLSLKDVLTALEDNNRVSGGNFLEHNREQYIIRGFGQYRSDDDILKVRVNQTGENPIFIRDVATIEFTGQLRQGAVTKDGQGEVVTGIVMMLRGGNGKQVIEAIDGQIERINRGLPEGVKVESFYNQADMVNRTTRTLSVNLLEGGLLVIVVLLVLLGDVRGALIVASVIPGSMLFAFIGMREFGLAANLMSLGAIDFGMIVDGSVVMVENIAHRFEKDGRSNPLATMMAAAHEVVRPIFFGVLIILMVYLPVMTFSGIEGILFRPMAITVATAVLGSLILTLVYIPAIASFVYRNGVQTKPMPWFENMRNKYTGLLVRIMDHPRRTVASISVFFILTMALIPFMGTEFIPELDEGSILVEQIRMPSVTLEESVENANWFAGQILAAIPEIKTVVPKTGRSDLANDWMGVHQTDVWVVLKPPSEWRRGMEKTDIIRQIEPYLLTEPGMIYNITQPIAMRVDELTSGVKSDVAIKIYGESLDTLSAIANRMLSVVNQLEGTANAFVESSTGQPYITITIDRDAVAQYGLNVDDVQRVIETGLGGSIAGEVYEGQRRFDLVVRYPEDIRDQIEKLRLVPVSLSSGAVVSLDRLSNIQLEEGPREIARDNGWRRSIVGINLEGIDIGTYVSNLDQAVRAKAQVPSGYFIEYGGAFEDQQRAMRHLFFVVPISLFIITMLMYINFGNIRYVLLILTNLPFALSGGIVALWMRGMYISVTAGIGFVALFGVAVLNGIVLVTHINSLRANGMGLKISTVRGAADRLRPVLMTALVASLGFIPMALNTGPGSEVQRPLATVVIGGLITATLLTLFVLPMVYKWMENRYETSNK